MIITWLLRPPHRHRSRSWGDRPPIAPVFVRLLSVAAVGGGGLMLAGSERHLLLLTEMKQLVRAGLRMARINFNHEQRLGVWLIFCFRLTETRQSEGLASVAFTRMGASVALPLKLWEFGPVSFREPSPAPGGPAWTHQADRCGLAEGRGVLSATLPSAKQKRAAANVR